MPALRGGKTEEGEEGTPVPVWPETSPDVLLPGVSSAGGGGGLDRARARRALSLPLHQPQRLWAALSCCCRFLSPLCRAAWMQPLVTASSLRFVLAC